MLSHDGDQGFPGEVLAKVRYSLTEDNHLNIEFQATTDKVTPVAMCNHCYFHLGEQSLDGLALKLNARSYLPTDEKGIPTGEIKKILGDDFRFDKAFVLGTKLTCATDEQINMANKGFDHCYVLTKTNNLTDVMNTAMATLVAKTTGIKLEIFTDQVGMQLYTAQYLKGEFKPYQAVCLEAQDFPNAINEPNFDSNILMPKQKYQKTVTYHFSRILSP